MPPPLTDPALAAAVAASLTASGIPAVAQVRGGDLWLALALTHDLSAMGFLDLADLTYAVTSAGGVHTLLPDGPLAPGAERCDDPSCISAGILAWVLARRARQH